MMKGKWWGREIKYDQEVKCKEKTQKKKTVKEARATWQHWERHTHTQASTADFCCLCCVVAPT